MFLSGRNSHPFLVDEPVSTRMGVWIIMSIEIREIDGKDYAAALELWQSTGDMSAAMFSRRGQRS